MIYESKNVYTHSPSLGDTLLLWTEDDLKEVKSHSRSLAGSSPLSSFSCLSSEDSCSGVNLG